MPVGRGYKEDSWLTNFKEAVETLKEVKAIKSTQFNSSQFAADINYMRQKDHLSLRDLAEMIDVSATTLSRLEGGHLPYLLTYAKICMYLECDMNKYFS